MSEKPREEFLEKHGSQSYSDLITMATSPNLEAAQIDEIIESEEKILHILLAGRQDLTEENILKLAAVGDHSIKVLLSKNACCPIDLAMYLSALASLGETKEPIA